MWRLLCGVLLIMLTMLTMALATCAAPGATSPGARPLLILISLDGWRWDYRGLAPTPTLDRLRRAGARAERLVPVFPTSTFPNHYSMVTGLYPDHHGIVSNNMYDAALGRRFSLSNRAAVADGRWWGGEPIWVTAERAGQPTATLFWPGSEAEIRGVRPSHWRPFDGAVPNAERVDRLLAWLDLPEEQRPAFLTLYFEDVDVAGHEGGPGSPEVGQAMRVIDEAIGRLWHGLEARNLIGRANLIVVSDHGMARTSPDRVIVLDDYLDLSAVDVIDLSPMLGIRPVKTTVNDVMARLGDAHPNLRVYRKEDLPERWHFGRHPRVPPVIGLADEGWTILRRRSLPARAKNWNYGAHGYDNALQSMHGIFIAAGPAFRPGTTLEPFACIHLYPLLAAILGLTPVASDADAGVTGPLLVAAGARVRAARPGR